MVLAIKIKSKFISWVNSDVCAYKILVIYQHSLESTSTINSALNDPNTLHY